MTTVQLTRTIKSDAQKRNHHRKDKAGANQCDSPKGEPQEQFSLSASSKLIYRTAVSPVSHRQRVPDDAMITSTYTPNPCRIDSNSTDHRPDPPGGLRFGRRFGRFGSVWSTSTKFKSQDGNTENINLVDLVDIHTGEVRGVRAPAPARARPRPRAVLFLPPDEFDQIDQIGKRRIAVQRLAFGRSRPNATKRPGYLDQIGTPPGDVQLVRGGSA